MNENRRFKLNLIDKRVLVLISAVLTLLVLNLGFSNYYLKEILNSVEKTEDIMGDFNARMRLTQTENANCFRSEIVGRVYCGTEINDWVNTKVNSNARLSRIDLEVETFKLNEIKLILFGNEFKSAIDKYTDHANTWLDYYKRVESCSDYNCYYSELNKPNDISTTFRIAEVEFKSAIPLIDLFGSKSRLEAIFKD
jgi:hypothetical protein